MASTLNAACTRPPFTAGENDLGTFTLASTGALTGFVRDKLGAPIVGAHVRLAAEPSLTEEREADTDGSGRYVIGHASDGSHGVNAEAKGFLSKFLKPFDVRRNQTTPPERSTPRGLLHCSKRIHRHAWLLPATAQEEAGSVALAIVGVASGRSGAVRTATTSGRILATRTALHSGAEQGAAVTRPVCDTYVERAKGIEPSTFSLGS